MAELSTTLTIIDKTSDQLENIVKSAEKASIAVDSVDSVLKSVSENTSMKSLAGDVEAFSSGIERSIDSVNTEISKTPSKIEAVGNAFRRVATAVQDFGQFVFFAKSAIAPLERVFNQITQTIGEGDSIAKNARALKINSDAYQELSYAAQRGGASVSEFDIALRTLSRRTAEFRAGSESAAKAFEAVGLSVEDLKGKDAEQILYAISDSLNGIGDAAKAEDAAFDLLGVRGTKVISAFSVGSDELKQLQAEARQTGAVLSEDTLAESERGADRLLDLQLSMQGLGRSFLSTLITPTVDAIETITKNLQGTLDVVSKIGNLASKVITPIVKIIGDGIGAALNLVSKFVDLIVSVVEPVLTPIFEGLNYIFSGISSTLGSISFKRNVYGDKEELAKGNQQNQRFFNFVEKKIDSMTGLLEDSSKAFESLSASITGTTVEQNQYDQAMSEYITKTNAARENMAIRDMASALGVRVSDLTRGQRLLAAASAQTTGGISNETDYLEALNQMFEKEKEVERLQNLGDYEAARLLSAWVDDAKWKTMVYENMKRTFDETKAINKNTKKVSIDRDDIAYMKQMSNAEIINRYNNIASSVVQNNTFNNSPGARTAYGLTKAALDAARGRALAY